MTIGEENNNDGNIVCEWKYHSEKMKSCRFWCAAATINDHQMIITGGCDDSLMASVELFDMKAKKDDEKVQELSQMNIARRDHVSIVHGDYVYVMGGDDSKIWLNSVERLNINRISTSKWEMMAPMKKGRSSFAASIHDNFIYVFGGEVNGDGGSGRSERYDISTNVWQPIPAMNDPRDCHVAVTVGDKLYVIGGSKSFDEYLKSMEIFDTQSQTWEDGIDMPIALTSLAAFVVNTWIVVLGGLKNNGNEINEDVFIFDTASSTWKTIKGGSAYHTPRKWFAATLLEQDTILIVGGKDREGKMLDSIECGKIYEMQPEESVDTDSKEATDHSDIASETKIMMGANGVETHSKGATVQFDIASATKNVMEAIDKCEERKEKLLAEIKTLSDTSQISKKNKFIELCDQQVEKLFGALSLM